MLLSHQVKLDFTSNTELTAALEVEKLRSILLGSETQQSLIRTLRCTPFLWFYFVVGNFTLGNETYVHSKT